MTMPTKTPDADASLSLLQRLVDDAMDPGYRRVSKSRSRPGNWRDQVVIALVFCVLAALVVAAIVQVREGAPADGSTRAELATRVQTATEALLVDEARVERLAGDVDQTRVAALADTDASRALAAEAAELESVVGGAAVSGPGLTLTLQDGPPTPAGDDGPDLARVLDTDIQLVVNGLFASGAQAVSVNGQRVTVLSPIRSAGEAVLVGFRPLTPPYEVMAVGPVSLGDAFEESAARTELAALESTYGIGVEVERLDDVSVPGRSDLNVRYAEEARR